MADKTKDTKIDTNNGVQVNINLDTTPIFYTDNISIVANSDGVTFDVMQRVGTSNQMRVVARFGMSRDHANKFIKELGKLLVSTENSILPIHKTIN